MTKIDELILAAGTTGNHQVWFTRPEVVKLTDLILKECIDICTSKSLAILQTRLIVDHFTEKNRLSSMEMSYDDIADTISGKFSV